jgi:hypothetical protein
MNIEVFKQRLNVDSLPDQGWWIKWSKQFNDEIAYGWLAKTDESTIKFQLQTGPTGTCQIEGNSVVFTPEDQALFDTFVEEVGCYDLEDDPLFKEI